MTPRREKNAHRRILMILSLILGCKHLQLHFVDFSLLPMTNQSISHCPRYHHRYPFLFGAEDVFVLFVSLTPFSSFGDKKFFCNLVFSGYCTIAFDNH
jgi:hypothetical protein